jgi:hypothetical protein
VIVFDHESYGGPSAYLSQNYANLGVIGWNDRITSFKALNSQSGHFAEHANNGGAWYSFCCNQQVLNVGSAWNDKFSSVYRH